MYAMQLSLAKQRNHVDDVLKSSRDYTHACAEDNTAVESQTQVMVRVYGLRDIKEDWTGLQIGLGTCEPRLESWV